MASADRVIRVRSLTTPPGVESWQWDQIKAEVGDLILATVVDTRTIHVVDEHGEPETLHQHTLKYHPAAFDRMFTAIHEACGGEEDAAGEDDREFGPQGDWWRQCPA